MTFVTINALVANVTVLGSGSLDQLAFRTKMFAGHFSKDVGPAEIWVRLQIAWLITGHVSEGKRQLRHAHRCGQHEVPNVENGLDNNDLVDPYENEQD